jgi:hypothetical protein
MATLDTLAAAVDPVSPDRMEDASGGFLVFFFFYWLGYQIGKG